MSEQQKELSAPLLKVKKEGKTKKVAKRQVAQQPPATTQTEEMNINTASSPPPSNPQDVVVPSTVSAETKAVPATTVEVKTAPVEVKAAPAAVESRWSRFSNLWSQAFYAMSPAQVYNYQITELMSSVDQDPTLTQKVVIGGKIIKMNIKSTFDMIIEFSNFRVNFLIMLSSFLFTMIAFVNNLLGDVLLRYKFEYTSFSALAAIGFSIACGLIGTHICKFVKFSEGSALPEIRSILSGTPYPGFFDFRIFMAKFAGLIFGRLSGAGVGVFAPFVHMSAIFTNSMFDMPFFNKISNDHNLQFAIISTMSVTPNVVYYAPIGSIFFASEFFGSNIKMYSLFRIVLAATVAYFTSKMMNLILNISLPPPMNVKEWYTFDTIHFIALGVIGASLNWGTVWVFNKVFFFKRASNSIFFTNRYIYTSFVTLLIILLSYQHSFFASSMRTMMFDFFTVSDFSKEKSYIDFWYPEDPLWFILELSYLLGVRILMVILMITLPLPAGIFGPAMVMGIVLGRLYGEVAVYFLGCQTSPTVFALAGGGLIVCIINKSFSPLMFIVEFSRNFDFILPIFVTYISGYLMSSIMNLSFLEMMLAVRKIPFLLAIAPGEKAVQQAALLAKSPPFPLFTDSTLKSLFENILTLDLKNTRDFDNIYIPILSTSSKFIESYITLFDAYRYLQARIKKLSSSIQSKRSLGSVSQSLVLITERNSLSFVDPEKQKIIDNIKILFDLNNAKPIEMSVDNLPSSNSEFKPLYNSQERDINEVFDLKIETIKRFLSSLDIKYSHPLLNLREQPIVIPGNSKVIRVQFMFLSLKVKAIWVYADPRKGFQFISLQDFLKYKMD